MYIVSLYTNVPQVRLIEKAINRLIDNDASVGSGRSLPYNEQRWKERRVMERENEDRSALC